MDAHPRMVFRGHHSAVVSCAGPYPATPVDRLPTVPRPDEPQRISAPSPCPVRRTRDGVAAGRAGVRAARKYMTLDVYATRRSTSATRRMRASGSSSGGEVARMTEAATALWAIVILLAGLLMPASILSARARGAAAAEGHRGATGPCARRDPGRPAEPRADDKVGGDVGSMSGSGSAPCFGGPPSEARDHRWSARCTRASRVSVITYGHDHPEQGAFSLLAAVRSRGAALSGLLP